MFVPIPPNPLHSSRTVLDNQLCSQLFPLLLLLPSPPLTTSSAPHHLLLCRLPACLAHLIPPSCFVICHLLGLRCPPPLSKHCVLHQPLALLVRPFLSSPVVHCQLLLISPSPPSVVLPQASLQSSPPPPLVVSSTTLSCLNMSHPCSCIAHLQPSLPAATLPLPCHRVLLILPLILIKLSAACSCCHQHKGLLRHHMGTVGSTGCSGTLGPGFKPLRC
jgi:hypothetical protein